MIIQRTPLCPCKRQTKIKPEATPMPQHLITKNRRFRRALALPWLALGIGACSQLPTTPQPHQPSSAEQNKQIAVAFLTMIFNDHQVAEAFEKYSVPDYRQHNPFAASGAPAAISFLAPYLQQNPEFHTDIKRVIAEGDLVAIHNNPKRNASDRGRAVVDIFRVTNGKVVEHWDVVQDVPERSANENTMF
jgi:predicted SnoaL-like aldol condensation-catalyzing enzyme